MLSAEKNKRSVRFWLLLSASLLALAVVGLVFIAGNTSADHSMFVLIAPYRTGRLTSVMNFISFYGNHQFLVPANLVLVAFFLVKKNRQLALLTLLTALSSLGLMSLIKNLVQRHRPPEPLVDGVTNYSFPSGHAFMSVAFYGLLIWLVFAAEVPAWKRRTLVTLLLLLIAVIGFSRIYLRLHYLSDVVAGFCLGTIWLIICLQLVPRLGRYFRPSRNSPKGKEIQP